MTDPYMKRTIAPPREPAPIAKTLKYKEAQEHILRRLGSALVLQWDALSDELQDLIVDQAALLEDRQDAPHAAEDIENFIRGAKTAPLSKPAATPETA
jgi:hypothetical protein